MVPNAANAVLPDARNALGLGAADTPNFTALSLGGNRQLIVGTVSTSSGVGTSQSLFLGLNAGAAYNLAGVEDYGVVAIGNGALQSLTTLDTEDVAVGAWSAQYSNGGGNAVVGMHALGADLSGSSLAALGADAFRDAFTNGSAVAVGQHAFAHGNIGNGDIAIGASAGK